MAAPVALMLTVTQSKAECLVRICKARLDPAAWVCAALLHPYFAPSLTLSSPGATKLNLMCSFPAELRTVP